MFAHGEPITRLRAPVTSDPYSGEPDGALDWEFPYDLVIPGCGFDPGGSSEPLEVGRASVVTQPRLIFLGQFPDIQSSDRVVRRGKVYDVVGEPEVWDNNPFTGWAAGMVVNLRAVEG